MFLTELSIKRPVVATVMSLVLVIFGIVTFNKIPLRELPDVETAKINIRTDYNGASAKIIDTQITQKIEERVGGTPGLINIDSTSEDERSSINLEFDLGVDLDVAANDVRDRIARIVDDLPEQAEPPQVFKASAARTTTMWLAFQSARMTDLELTDYADRYLKDEFANVAGVGLIRLGGEREFSLRLWLDPVAMAARDITTDELENILRKENVEFPAGKIESKSVDLVIKVEKAYQDLNDYKELALKRAPDGSIIKLKDIANIEFGALNTNTLFKGNGNQTVGIGIYQQSTANTIEVADRIKEKIKTLQPTLPAGSSLSVSFDRSRYIEAAIYEVYKTIFIAIILVLGLSSWYLFNENQTLVANNVKLESAVEEQKQTIQAIKDNLEKQGKALQNLQRKNAQIEADKDKYLSILSKHNFEKLAIARPGLMEIRFNNGTDEVLRELENDTKEISNLDSTNNND